MLDRKKRSGSKRFSNRDRIYPATDLAATAVAEGVIAGGEGALSGDIASSSCSSTFISFVTPEIPSNPHCVLSSASASVDDSPSLVAIRLRIVGSRSREFRREAWHGFRWRRAERIGAVVLVLGWGRGVSGRVAGTRSAF